MSKIYVNLDVNILDRCVFLVSTSCLLSINFVFSFPLYCSSGLIWLYGAVLRSYYFLCWYLSWVL